jgi:hypothetical protein
MEWERERWQGKYQRLSKKIVTRENTYGKKRMNRRKEGHFRDKGNRSPIIRKKSEKTSDKERRFLKDIKSS